MGKIAKPLTLCLIAALASTPALANTIHVAAGFTSQTVTALGGLNSAKTKAQAQLDQVEQTLNAGAGTQYDFVIDSAYQFSSGLATQLSSAPSARFDLKIIYDAAPTGNGGFYNSSRTIYHAWDNASFGGIMGDFATQSLYKTVGLSRGGFNLSAENTSAYRNTISNEAYATSNSIFSSPYGTTSVDSYNQLLLQSRANVTGANMNLALDQLFPDSILVKTVDSTGAKLSGAQVRLYPIATASDSVASQYVFSDSTKNGASAIPAGIYGLGDASNDYRITRSNFLAEVSYGTARKFAWLPISKVQLAKLNGTNKYETTVQLPVLAAPPATDLGASNGNYYLSVSGSGQESNFTISQFPNWSYSKVVIAYNAVNSPMSGSVYVNGNYYGQVSGWYQTITVNQSTAAPINMKFVSNNPQQISIRWWVLN